MQVPFDAASFRVGGVDRPGAGLGQMLDPLDELLRPGPAQEGDGDPGIAVGHGPGHRRHGDDESRPDDENGDEGDRGLRRQPQNPRVTGVPKIGAVTHTNPVARDATTTTPRTNSSRPTIAL